MPDAYISARLARRWGARRSNHLYMTAGVNTDHEKRVASRRKRLWNDHGKGQMKFVLMTSVNELLVDAKHVVSARDGLER